MLILISKQVLENREIGVSPIRAQRCKGDCLILSFYEENTPLVLLIDTGKAFKQSDPKSEDRPED